MPAATQWRRKASLACVVKWTSTILLCSSQPRLSLQDGNKKWHSSEKNRRKFSGSQQWDEVTLRILIGKAGGQRYTPAAIPPGIRRYPLYSMLRGPPGRSGWVRKIPAPTGIWSPNRLLCIDLWHLWCNALYCTTRVTTHTCCMYCCHNAGVDRRDFKFSVLNFKNS